MSDPRFLTDEHVPGPFITALRSLGYDVRRSKDALAEGADDSRLLSFAADSTRIVITCDRRFTVIGGQPTTDHAGVIYGDQPFLQTNPADAADGIDRIVTTIPTDELAGTEFYLNDWLR